MQIFHEKPELIDILFSFIPPIAIYLINNIINLSLNISLFGYITILLTLIIVINFISLRFLTPYIKFSIYWRSCIITNIMLISIIIITQNKSINSFGFYLFFLSIFHLSEYLITLISNYKTLNTNSFLLNHSFEYNLAAIVSWIEYFIEVYFFPQLKTYKLLWIIGAIFIIFGEIVRKLAMYTAGTSFNHLVQSKKSDDHVLIKHGIYSFSRHPSYFGWFYWSVGTQILLANPLCVIAYAYASWKFFNARILSEEFFLTDFFGNEYIDYAKRVPIRIPFIKGYINYEIKLD